jgi:hypothetical protein
VIDRPGHVDGDGTGWLRVITENAQAGLAAGSPSHRRPALEAERCEHGAFAIARAPPPPDLTYSVRSALPASASLDLSALSLSSSFPLRVPLLE